MSTITGNDVAALHRAATRHAIRFLTDPGLNAPYVIDRDERVIYLNGCLPYISYYVALEQGISELAGNVIPLRNDHRFAV